MGIPLALNLDGVRMAVVLAKRDGTRTIIATGFPESTIEEARIHVTPCAILRKPFDE